MKTLVLYKSVTGFTKKYAEWIADALAADISPAASVSLQKMKEYDCIVFGGRLYASGISGLSLIKKNLDNLQGKRLVVFATGASPASESVIADIKNNNLDDRQRSQIEFFYLRGGFDYDALPFFDKILMSLLRKSIERKKRKGKALTGEEAGMLELYEGATDFTSRDHIDPIVQAARGHQSDGK